MRYEVVDVLRAGLVGHAVLDTESGKLTSINLFSRQEADVEALRQNEAAAIKANWPGPDDSEVFEFMNSTEFEVDVLETMAYARHRAEEHIARKRAGL